MDLLTISLEVLNTYFTEHENTIKLKQLHIDLKNNNSNTNKQFIKLIKYIYKVKLIIDKYLLNEIANEILKNYAKSKKCNLTNKYYEKFYNRCCATKEYYKNCKLSYHTYKTDVYDIALINLYIISQSTKTEGLYILIKYLSN
nr:hypothetical protein [Echinothamnion sp.]